VRFEDPAFGVLRVAIAEKINESARGTGRSGRVRERMNALLAQVRRTSGREVGLPFSVFVEEQGEGSRGEIYNAGAAASEEALEAYLEARRGELLVVRRSVTVSELHPNIRNRFAFPRPELDLVLCASATTRALVEGYVEQGQARFKGFEITEAVAVHEILDEASPFLRAIATYHFAEWLAQSDRPA
jgi:hypothetical protein